MSEPEESGGGGPGTISSGRGDPGGASYGTWQLSSQIQPNGRSMVQAFVQSDFARPWARQLQGLAPRSEAFNRAWREIAAADPQGFEEAQYRFIRRENYESLANRVRNLGLDLDGRSRTLRDVTWSTSVQHGSRDRFAIFRDAIRAVDREMRRDDPRYEEALIRQIYDRRIASALRQRVSGNDLGRWNYFNNIATIRFPREREAALRMLTEERAGADSTSGRAD